VLHHRAGPIGGRSQASAYKIGCRFDIQSTLEKLKALRSLRSRVLYAGVLSYKRAASLSVVRNALEKDEQSVLWYLDPPFFRKADTLYNRWFEEQHHRDLFDWIKHIRGNWVLSYDDVPECNTIWGEHPGLRKVHLKYTASKRRRKNGGRQSRTSSTEVVISNLHCKVTEKRRCQSKET
jgi:DNA adenine methylase